MADSKYSQDTSGGRVDGSVVPSGGRSYAHDQPDYMHPYDFFALSLGGSRDVVPGSEYTIHSDGCLPSLILLSSRK